MKRQWKVDRTVPVGYVVIWKGDITKIPVPWVEVDEHPYLMAGESLGPNFHLIMKVDNLKWLENQYDKKHS